MIKRKSKVKKKNRREEIFCFSTTKKNSPLFSAHNLYYLSDSLVHTWRFPTKIALCIVSERAEGEKS